MLKQPNSNFYGLKLNEINIRDPFVIENGGKYYLFGTRFIDGKNDNKNFYVNVSKDLQNWSEAVVCCDITAQGLDKGVRWAPEVFEYNNKFYMFATFTQDNGKKGTYSLVSDNVAGPYLKCSEGALTPENWESLDGTLYIDKNEKPYLVFSHEYIDNDNIGTICYVPLNDSLSAPSGEVKYMFSAIEPDFLGEQNRYVTDGPFMYRTKQGELIMIWTTVLGSTGSKERNYTLCMALSDNKEIDGKFLHLEPLYKKDGGHGMIFKANGSLLVALHSPDRPYGAERPVFLEITESEDGKSLIPKSK